MPAAGSDEFVVVEGQAQDDFVNVEGTSQAPQEAAPIDLSKPSDVASDYTPYHNGVTTIEGPSRNRRAAAKRKAIADDASLDKQASSKNQPELDGSNWFMSAVAACQTRLNSCFVAA